jgi:hypothetical protein
MNKCDSIVNIKEIEYDVIAYKYGGYGILHVFIYWQNNRGTYDYSGRDDHVDLGAILFFNYD